MTGLEIFFTGVAALITSLGGIEFIKFLWSSYITRKSSKKKDEVDTVSLEVEPYKQQNEFLINQLKSIQEFNQTQLTQMQTQIIERDGKIDYLTQKVEILQKTINELLGENQEIKKKMIDNGCMKFDCASRVK